MVTLAQLKKQKAVLQRRAALSTQKSNLKKDIFNLKYGGYISSAKRGLDVLRGYAQAYDKRSRKGGNKSKSSNFSFKPGSVF